MRYIISHKRLRVTYPHNIKLLIKMYTDKLLLPIKGLLIVFFFISIVFFTTFMGIKKSTINELGEYDPSVQVLNRKDPLKVEKYLSALTSICEKNSMNCKNSNLDFRIPFYIYDFEETNWYSNCIKDYPWLDYTIPENFDKQWYYHSDDFIFIKRILNHPWRVLKPEQAEVFILPTLFSFYSGFGNHESADPENEPQENLRYGGPWNLDNLKCNGKSFDELVTIMTQFLVESETFQKYGQVDDTDNYRTHLMVNSHFFVSNENTMELLFGKHNMFLREVLPNFSMGTFESLIHKSFVGWDTRSKKAKIAEQMDRVIKQKPAWRCSVIVPYVENKWLPGNYSKIDRYLENGGFSQWKKREYDLFFVGRMQMKLSYLTRRMVADSLQRTHELMTDLKDKPLTYLVTESYSPTIQYRYLAGHNNENEGEGEPLFPTCTELDCLTLKRCTSCQLTPEIQNLHNAIGLNSKFALIIHGDTSTTSRLYDAIMNGLIPIIISPSLYQDGLPFQSIVPWRDISFNLPFSWLDDKLDTKIIAKNLYNIVNYPEYLLEHKFKKLVKIRKELSWLDPGSRIIENILDDAKNQCIL